MAISSCFVDSSNGDNAGAGTVGDPWQTIQYACDTLIDDASTSVGQINLRSNANHACPAGGISLATYFANNGATTQGKPLIFRGYTTAENDGGGAVLDGGGNANNVFTVITYDGIVMADLTIQNFGNAGVDGMLRLDDYCILYNVTIANPGSDFGVIVDSHCLIIRCRMYGAPARAMAYMGAATRLVHSWFKATGGCSVAGIETAITGAGAGVQGCIIDVSGVSATPGIYVIGASANNVYIQGNSIYANASTSAGILCNGSMTHIYNNMIEGFSGVGGIGISIAGATRNLGSYGHNKFYNNTTHESLLGEQLIQLGNNDALGASPFTAPGSNDFSVDDTLKALGYPTNFLGASTNTYIDVGAAQREEAGGGGFPTVGPGFIRPAGVML